MQSDYRTYGQHRGDDIVAIFNNLSDFLGFFREIDMLHKNLFNALLLKTAVQEVQHFIDSSAEAAGDAENIGAAVVYE